MSIILDVLGIDSDTTFFSNRLNLYHNGDDAPFANVELKDGMARIRVNPGEVIPFASHVEIGK